MVNRAFAMAAGFQHPHPDQPLESKGKVMSMLRGDFRHTPVCYGLLGRRRKNQLFQMRIITILAMLPPSEFPQ